MKKILIIGGCGYIGSKLFQYLTGKNYSVDTVDLEWFGNYINPKNLRYDYDSLKKSFFDRYDVVILLAGHSTVDMCNKDILGSFKNNVENFVRLLTKLNRQKFIFASTYRVYHTRKNHLAKETDEIHDPNSIYDLTKETIEHYAAFSSLEFYSLRMATVNGYSPNLRENQIINKLFLSSLTKNNITIFDQHAKFSLLGIEDLCRAIEKIVKGKDLRGIYNLKSLDTTLYNLVKEAAVLDLDLDITAKTSVKPHHICIDSTRFGEVYNFTFKETAGSIITSLLNNYTKNSHILQQGINKS